MGDRVYIRTFGCRANQYDSEAVRDAVEASGGVIVERPEDATVAVFNSCAVTAAAESDLRRSIRQASRANASLRTLVMGCAAARDRGPIAALPSVEHVIGGADMPAIAAALGIRHTASTQGPSHQTATRALLRIQDGCDEHCTFCATTIARGANRSRPVSDLIAEARALAEHHAEIVITGVHIGTYGRDRALRSPEAPRGSGPRLGELLDALVAAAPAVRFRLSSIEATEVDDRLAALLLTAPRHLAPHLHAPLQSGSDRVLRRMGRHWYTARTYCERIEWLAERLPVFGLGADVIAGFPGETEADHRATLELLERLPFTYLHVFPFSIRPDAPAARLTDHLRPAVITRRAGELRALGAAKAAAHRTRRRGVVADGVVTGHRGGRVEVLTEDYLSVYLPVERWDGRSRFSVTVE